MKTATFIKKLDNFSGDARLYRLSEPVNYWGDDYPFVNTNFVVVSAVVGPFSGAETFIFPSDEHGKVLDCRELDGSYWGGLDHEKALKNAGYSISKGE